MDARLRPARPRGCGETPRRRAQERNFAQAGDCGIRGELVERRRAWLRSAMHRPHATTWSPGHRARFLCREGPVHCAPHPCTLQVLSRCSLCFAEAVADAADGFDEFLLVAELLA